ncbi:MAG TPA: hypothetical protein GYA07_03440 [Verrucomicrobia bacterium]|nr:hypothetical protein [Verrucomicrobiota bacterium]HOP96664.1 multiheme c-type cytochrome [Verrucomicrobiota bacterium]HPU54731.1 multiheme c-type cytochrome [Verrucomicrobiota bacterium]
MKIENALLARGILALSLTLISVPATVRAQAVEHLTITQPGGMPGLPVVTGIERGSNSVTIQWDGPPGYYRIYESQDLANGTWQQAGPPVAARRATITVLHSNAFFRVSGPAPQYAGSQACLECHESIHNEAMHTRHAHALDTLKQIHQANNPACLVCHTVGYGLPTGFVDESRTPHLAGVQCENCHGPAAAHAANDSDPTLRPRADFASTVCGGCHTGSHHPTYDEWKTSGHAVVVEDMNASSRIDSCGRCHSGSVRLAMLKNGPLPHGDANHGIGCVTCHDPHRSTGHPAQLRNPTASTNDYFLSSSDVFADTYDPDINVCAQCHNHRGATWTSSTRPPHHSPQYNMLVGTVGVLPEGMTSGVGAHGRFVEKQCAGCHMEKAEYESEAHPASTGHRFNVSTYASCGQCHPFPELLAAFATTAVSNQIVQLKEALDLWGETRAPEPLRTKYGALAWEYTTPGSLSAGGSGPSSSEQALIPENIRKARFNLYVVLYDGSFGVHNGAHASGLLEAARNWVRQELDP